MTKSAPALLPGEECYPPTQYVAVVAIPKWLAVTTIALLSVAALAACVSVYLLHDVSRILAVR